MSAAGPQWKVTSVTPATGQVSSGQFGPGWNVTYQLESGATGIVFVPKSGGDPDAIKAAIAADAATLHAIANLSSG
jgi:hypothetical protein